MKKIINYELIYDYYNNRWRNDKIIGTLTSHTSTNGSGTFWIVVKEENEKEE